MLKSAVKLVDTVIAGLGKIAALFILAIIATMVLEMAMRGLFGMSTPWAGDVSSWLLVGVIFLGGPWALANGNFVRVDAVFGIFPPRVKALIDSTVSTVLFVLFAYVLIAFGGDLALRSFQIGETSATGSWNGPVWVSKALVPIGTCLLSLAWLSHVIRSWQDLKRDGTNTNHD